MTAVAVAAMTVAFTAPTPASAIGVYVGPRGVHVGIGRPGYRYGYRRPFVRPGIVVRRGFYHGRWRRF